MMNNYIIWKMVKWFSLLSIALTEVIVVVINVYTVHTNRNIKKVIPI